MNLSLSELPPVLPLLSSRYAQVTTVTASLLQASRLSMIVAASDVEALRKPELLCLFQADLNDGAALTLLLDETTEGNHP